MLRRIAVEVPAAMHTYFCTQCDRSVESVGCIQEKAGLRLLCPRCRRPVWISGGVLAMAALLWYVLWAMVPCPEAGFIAPAGGASLGAVGALRLLKQFRARRTRC